MKKGLLWYDDNPERDLVEKIERATRRYEQKFGAQPDVCYVHPNTLKGNGKLQKIDDVRVTSLTSMLRHHFWVGREEQRAG